MMLSPQGPRGGKWEHAHECSPRPVPASVLEIVSQHQHLQPSLPGAASRRKAGGGGVLSPAQSSSWAPTPTRSQVRAIEPWQRPQSTEKSGRWVCPEFLAVVLELSAEDRLMGEGHLGLKRPPIVYLFSLHRHGPDSFWEEKKNAFCMKLSPHSLVFYTCDLGHIFLSELSLLICKIIIISVTSWGYGAGVGHWTRKLRWNPWYSGWPEGHTH